MRFAEFLRATVLLSAGAATLLAVQTVIAVSERFDPVLLYVGAGWWLGAVVIGLWLGRRSQATPAIARLLAGARAQPILPSPTPAKTLLNRLWPLLLSTLLAVVVGLWLPQVPAIAAGFAMVWALAWRRQHAAVEAVEERDGVRFYVEQVSPLHGIRLIRTPGFGGDFLHVDGQAQAR